MKIIILGTRGEIKASAPYHSKRSGVLIDNKILIDCGDKRFLQYNPTYILITHLHPDHAYFVRKHEVPDTHASIYAPEKYDQADIQVTNKKFKIGTYTITPIPTIHSIYVKSNAYIIEHNGKRILYTGDMIWIEKKYQKKIGKLDLVITEASFMRKGGMVRRQKDTGKIYGHTGVPNLINLFKKHTDTILFMHFGTWFYKDIKKARQEFHKLAQENNIHIIVGYDGLEVKV
ncbi:MAG TPA: MBL fold metallo-hydrolase [Candidatus Dependentiae bacterium]|nr:MBL fold metallo-hydrolase [Candidatus Dependentiae bacterium]HRQ62894.1 MBL fold metallo-hydrolase [Candidatus Dependentiae bacterium]